jgi:2-oxoglutarate ferredoxin oxidoreductase subunit gamma
MLERVIFAGFGGQGVLTLGKLTAGLGLGVFPHVTYFPSYGTEVRGGTANCQVILSSEEIASPVVERADSLIVMNQPSLERFLPVLLARGGRAYVNSSLAEVPDDPRVTALPATDLAADLGDVQAANMILLGAYLAGRKLFAREAVERFLVQRLKKKGDAVVELNLRALGQGWEMH